MPELFVIACISIQVWATTQEHIAQTVLFSPLLRCWVLDDRYVVYSDKL